MTITSGLKNVNMLTKEQYDGISELADDELYAVSGSGFGMPSNRYIDLTLGASGATYTAPANGWFDLNFSSSAQNGFIAMYARMSASATANSGRYGVSACIPVVKGENMSLFYGNGSASLFRFYYAEGEN